MPGTRIFISHSAKETETGAFLTVLKGRLDNEGFEVLLDKDGLELGDFWRSTLNLWIGGCDAALLVISNASLGSAFMAYEVSVLSYRCRSDAQFLLIPIFLDPVDEEMVNNSPLFEVTRLTEVQAVTGGTNADKINRVVGRLAGIQQRQSPIDRHAELLRARLSSIDEARLRLAAETLDVDLGTWVPNQDPARTLALKMIGVGLEEASKSIRQLRSEFPTSGRSESVSEMIDIVASSWVDCRTAGSIPAIARKPRPPALGGTSQAEPASARMYVIVAAMLDEVSLTPRDSWRSPVVDGVLGHDAIGDLKRSIQTVLSTELDIPEDAEFGNELAEYITYEPAFIILRAHAGITASLLEQLRDAFPGVTFFLLFGGTRPDPSILEAAGVEIVKPPLDPEFEQQFCKTYRSKRKYLLRGL